MLFLLEGFVFFEGDAVVESLCAFVAFWEEVETDTADVLLGAEGLGIIYLFHSQSPTSSCPILGGGLGRLRADDY